jgi:alpha-amylase
MSIMIRAVALLCLSAFLLVACSSEDPAAAERGRDIVSAKAEDPAVFWNSATVYFLLTDRFENGDPTNDLALGRAQDGAVLRHFQGGDLAGVLQKLEEGYFDALGIDAIWMTPFVEQIHGSVNEGTGKTYGFHGYWTRDWTAMEPALGSIDDLRALVDAAHRRGIRVLMDAIINHTGPVTPLDPQWPDDWVRTSPRCVYRDYTTTVDCTLVDNLPDVLTGRDDPVELPQLLLEKWEREGRLDQELAELDAFFERTGLPQAPRYYIIKWLTDWVRELGFDGYRMDTAKHIEEAVSAALKLQAEQAFADWKEAYPDQVLDDLPFYMMGEVYNYELSHGRDFDFGDRTVDFASSARPPGRWMICSPATLEPCGTGSLVGSRSSTTSARTTTGHRTTRAERIRSAQAPSSSSRRGAPRSTTGTNWPVPLGLKVPRATPTFAP